MCPFFHKTGFPYRGSPPEPARGHPSPADALLVVEVADTSLEFDRSVKVPLYARHGIAEVWLIDLQNRLLTIRPEPKDGIYRDTRTTGAPGTMELSQLPGASVDLGSLFQLS